ncbi:MAG TPA: thiamine pyrophosphate-dependent enzyme [Xanthobacteraceae bacterium]|jgi:thiamine pyrophosphate-dependent acetolactate synthase large subunit-like protein|nr:thiamine pyrophosphate-dependent enzyme [Xanthobacteraceae bacterium]
MAKQDQKAKVDRRKFLTGVAVAGAATAVASPDVAKAAASASAPLADPPRPSAIRPTAAVAAAETEVPKELPQASGPAGSDFMVDVIKSLDIEYMPCNPASSFRGLHESLINYGGNKKPEFLTCMHEESAVGMAHGYFKIAGKPLMVLCHGTVGLQHATMAIYNAWCDRVPVIIMGGTDLDASKRPPGVPTFHSAQDINALVRDFTKWDDQPVSLQHFAQSFVRAYKIAMTPPYEPVMIALDAEIQEETIHDRSKLTIPRYVPTAPPQGDLNAVREAARLLVNAERPVIVVDKAARTPNGVKLLVELAEALQAPVIDQKGRMNFPNTHHLFQTGRRAALISQADVIIGMELSDYWGTVNGWVDNGAEDGAGLRESHIKPNTKLISISSLGLITKANYQDFQRFQPVDIEIAGDAEATLPSLIEAVKAAIPNDRKAAFEKRGEAMKKAWAQTRERTKAAAALAWDASPISTARLSMEIWPLIKDLDWSLVSRDLFVSGWPSRLWPMDKYHHHIGGPGGFGVGYGLPAAVGAALANRAHGRFSVNIQCDGDMMYAPGALWTAARHQIPLLTVMHNNRGYHQETMHVQRMSNRRNRVAYLGKDLGPLGTRIENPNVDYAKLASSLGLWSAGPITDPKELGPVLKKAVDVVKAGEPALVDVVTQPR